MAAAAVEQQSVDQFKDQPRLPKFAVPRRYDLSLKVDLYACKFSGTVEINVEVVLPTRFLVLNAADLDVDHDSVRFRVGGSYQELRPSEVAVLEEDEILVLGFDGTLPLGEGVLGIRFTGALNDQMKGFYRSVYEVNGEKKNMAVTQFEPADCRRCFPSWDEPAFKATFKITLEVPSELIALSNMPATYAKTDGFVKTISFQESPIMLTYLVAIVVGLFDYVEDQSPDGIRVRVYTQVGKSNQGKFALDVGIKALDLYTKYFSVHYPLPKLDMVAISDFAAGAMENYGLVTFRDVALLYDDAHSSSSVKQSVTITVTHELAHQWFGNLVTMEWWTHLWLNEGFATWVDINRACEIDEIFDSISYCKGAAVIRMLQSYLGAECFQKSLAAYIKRYAYSNAKTEDLWAVLEEESGEPVRSIMESWTKQKGYPVVVIKANKLDLEIEQSHFLTDGTYSDGLWVVPITFCCGSYDIQNKFLLKTKSEKISMTEIIGLLGVVSDLEQSNQGESKQSWIKFNVDQAGFYRVKYDDELAAGLQCAIERIQLNSTDRFGILEDTYALCMAGKQTLSYLLSLLAAYKEESEYTVMSHLITITTRIVNLVGDAVPELFDDTKLIFINVLKFTAAKLGWDRKEGESDLDAMLRGEILGALVLFGHDSTVKEAMRRFSAFLDDSTPILPPDIRKAAYVAIMRNANTANRSGYESLLKIYRESNESEEKVRILGSLASYPDPDIVLEVLDFLLTSELGWDRKEGESDLDAMLRGEILGALVLFGHDSTVKEAMRRFSAFLDDSTPILPPDIRKAAYVAIMRNANTANRSGYESLLKIYRESNESEEKVRILGSLASYPDPDIVLEVLDFLLTSEVRNQDAIYGLRVSREGRETAWRWLKDNWGYISKTWGSSLLSIFISSIVSPFYTDEKQKEIEDFFAGQIKSSFARTLKQSLERIGINANWVRAVRDDHFLSGLVKELTKRTV